MTTFDRFQLPRDTAANWASNNPTVQAGVLTLETDTGVLKLHDGAAAYNATPILRTPPRTLSRFMAYHAVPPSANFATLDTRGVVPVLEFDAATEETTTFLDVCPFGAILGGGIEVRIDWRADTATSGAVVWGAAIDRLNGDLDSESFAAEVVATTSTDTGNAGNRNTTVITLSGSQIDGLVAGDAYRLRIARKVADAGDTMTGDAQILAVEVRSVS